MTEQHTSKAYDQELDEITTKVAQMGGLTEAMLQDAIASLSSFDGKLAQRAIEADPRVDALQREIENQAVLTIARRQPMAIDLRDLVGAIRIANDLERVGDLAKNIAKRVIKMGADPRLPRAVVGVRQMGATAAKQLKDVMDAFAARDVQLADSVWSSDAQLDSQEDVAFRDLLTFMMEDPRDISFCAHLLFCSKNIERIGDHTTNIAETIHYIATGDTLPMDRPKGEEMESAA
ncbi:MAG: phosphate signaling complex protein PhoU [Xanthobacteraceae bacterium]|nr:phosphate signaling complex protein PhoU [Xanthobacteraceae bacterium]